MNCGIYKITCKETGRCYIGQSRHIEVRWKEHHNRFPPDAFDYEIVAECLPIKETLNFWERHCIEVYESRTNGFNVTKGGNAWGWKNPQETGRKISEAQKGRKFSDEARHKMSEAKKGKPPNNKGKPMSIEQKAKLSEAVKGYYARKSMK